MPVELKKKASSATNSTKRQSRSNSSQKKSKKKPLDNSNGNGSDLLPESIRYLGGKHRTDHQRSKYQQQFKELTTVICASHTARRALAPLQASDINATAKLNTGAATAGPSFTSKDFVANAFPILSVGYLTRAMGLNVSDKQVTSIVELIEEDGMSTGFVDKRKLEQVIVDALLTRTIGGSTLREFAVAAAASGEEANAGKISLERLEKFTPSLCMRDNEASILRAFEALDLEQKGYLVLLDLHTPLTTVGERFSNEEIEEMWRAMQDPETSRLYYRDFVDVLARE
ncbi:hypothetical protein ABL78_6984 [Leptomonas seymouri]|uniref:EF-hand domain-containing protein n=1 Tax=Leptomonas seymouri TaxID=5684 RepID=A0A0N1I197_LEPSE|nr:hypothetical protein ABL78_6984 [Leptomonas seymouri]|eukprot:KPI83973.1 hypothetical protein ABL78_6984 [Leptomonas seymouri]